MQNKLPKYFQEYLTNYLSIQRNFSKHTISSYKYTFNEFLKFCVNSKNMGINNISLDTLNKEIKEKLEEIRKIKNERNRTVVEGIQELVDKLKTKRNKTIIHLYRNVYRLKKAFPAIETKEITEVLNQKIQIIKQRNKIKTKRKRGK